MRISRLEVDGFGVWSDLKLDGLAGGLNVFYGPNEAGKTTLMQFVRTVLYGFTPARRRYLPPVHGGRPGGSMIVTAPAGQYQVSRYAGPAEEGGDQLAVLAGDGSRHGEAQLRTLLSGLDEPIFENVFAVGLREIQELGTLNDTEAASLLYSLSIGLDRVSLVEVMRELDSSRNHLLDRAGGPCQVQQLLIQRDKLRAEIAEQSASHRRYARLAAEGEQVEREIGRLEEDQRQLDGQTRLLATAIAQRERWHERSALDEQIAAIGPIEPMPEGAVLRLDALNRRLTEHQAQVSELKRRFDQLRSEAAGLTVNEALWRQTPRVEALREQEGWVGTLQKRIVELEAEISQLEGRITAEQQKFGLAEGRGADALRTINSRSLAALREPAKALRRFEKRLERAQQEVTSGRETDKTLASRIESALASRGERNLAEAVDRTGGVVSQLRRRVKLDERIGEMEPHQTELEDRCRFLLEHQLLPMQVMFGLAGVFVLGLLLLFGSFLTGSITGPLAFLMAVLGLAASVGSVAAKLILTRNNARRLESGQKQLTMLQAQLKQAIQERDHLDAQLPRGGGSLASRLAAAEAELAALEELVPMDAQRQSARQEADAAAGRVRQAEQGLSVARRRWREALAKLGLPEGFTPRQVRGLLTRCDEIGETQRRLELRYEECQQRSHELESLSGRLAQLAAETHVALPAAGPAEQIRELCRLTDEQDSRRKRREVLRIEARQIKRKLAKYGAALGQLKRQRRELLRTCGVAGEPEFRARAAEIARAGELRSRRVSVQREIEAAIAGHSTIEALADHLDGPGRETMEDRLAQLRTRLAATQEQLAGRFELRGRLAEQIRVLAEDRQPAARQMALDAVQKRLDDSLHRWRTLAVAGRVLESVRKTYEKERQPETLLEASGYLERMTEGRYRRVWTPLSENVLLVDDAAGRSLGVEVLSQGTREQLFLALRLALAGCYARRGAVLPMILDDVLVDFDNQRAGAAAGVLRDFAALGHQLLVFTCHEHMVSIFRSLDVAVTELAGGGEPRPAAIEEPPRLAVHKPMPKRPKRKARPEPEPEPEPIVAQAPPPPPAAIRVPIPAPAPATVPPPTPEPAAEEPPRRPMVERPAPRALRPKPVEEPPRSPKPTEEESRRRRGLVPWEAPWGEKKVKQQPWFVSSPPEEHYVPSDAVTPDDEGMPDEELFVLEPHDEMPAELLIGFSGGEAVPGEDEDDELYDEDEDYDPRLLFGDDGAEAA